MGTDSIYMENTLTPDDIIARYNEKLKLYCDNIDPYSLDLAECSEAIVDLPNITTHQIYSYLMLSKCPYSGKHGERSLYQNSAETGQVTKIYTKNFDDITIVLGEILIPETGEYFNPWFVSFPYGYVLCAHCSCASGTNEMCIHIGGLLHKVQTLKMHCSIESTSCEKTSTPTETTPANVHDSHGPVERSSQLRKCHRMKRKKRVKMYVCGICMSQFSDKVTFMNHCQQNHTLPEFLSSNNHKRKRNKQANVNTTVSDRSGIYSKHLPLTVHPNEVLLENELGRAVENDVSLDEAKEFHSEIFDHIDERVAPATELPTDIIDLDNFIGADEMSVDEFLLAQRPYETVENGTADGSTKITEFIAIEVADDVPSLAEHSDIVSAISDGAVIKQDPDLIIIDEDLEALEQFS